MASSFAMFARDTIVRAVKTFAQTLVALITADGALGVLDVNWNDKFSVAGLAAVVSILTSIASYTAVGSAAAGEAVTQNNAVAVKVEKKTGELVAADGLETVANDVPVTVLPPNADGADVVDDRPLDERG